MNTGLSASNIRILKTVCAHYPEIKNVILFGSRAKGTYKNGSDIDIAIKGENINNRIINMLYNELDDSSLPYFVDIIHYDTIANPDLTDHIDRVGIIL